MRYDDVDVVVLSEGRSSTLVDDGCVTISVTVSFETVGMIGDAVTVIVSFKV